MLYALAIKKKMCYQRVRLMMKAVNCFVDLGSNFISSPELRLEGWFKALILTEQI